MSENISNSRRRFCARSLMILGALPILDATVRAAPAAAEVTAPVNPAEGQAVALGYVHDASKVDTTKFPKRAGPEGQKQFCKNCLFMQSAGLKADGQEGAWGKCAIFPMGLVSEAGWCNTWSPKPA